MSASLAISITSSVSGRRRGSIACGGERSVRIDATLDGKRPQRIAEGLPPLSEHASYHPLEQGGVPQFERQAAGT